MNGSLGGQQFGLGEKERRALSSLASELPAESHHFLLVVATQLLLDVPIFLVQTGLLFCAFFSLFIHTSADFFLECSQFCCLSGPESVDRCLNFEVACI
jgi:hypothetical protein